jgi:translation elongation factor EF-G|tara:strand:+ start:692 stop:1129 length:438 start_codon:yes stop_codon:yes gene_type:complete
MSWTVKHRANLNNRVWAQLFNDVVKPYMVNNKFDNAHRHFDTLEQQCEYDTERLDKYLEKLAFDLFNDDRVLNFEIMDECDYHDILWVVVNHYNDQYGDGMDWFNKCEDNQKLYALAGLMLWEEKRTDVIKFIDNNYWDNHDDDN